MKTVNIIALILVIIGGINWGLVGLFDFDLVAAIFGGETAILARIVYVIVGLAALYCLTLFKPITAYSDNRVATTRMS